MVIMIFGGQRTVQSQGSTCRGARLVRVDSPKKGLNIRISNGFEGRGPAASSGREAERRGGRGAKEGRSSRGRGLTKFRRTKGGGGARRGDRPPGTIANTTIPIVIIIIIIIIKIVIIITRARPARVIVQGRFLADGPVAVSDPPPTYPPTHTNR